MTHKVIIMRGQTCSGKDTVARRLASEFEGDAAILSTDNFFMVNGEYKFDFEKLAEAHADTHRQFIDRCRWEYYAVESKENFLTIISNTNTQDWEFMGYLHIGLSYGATVELHYVETPIEVSLERDNGHGVPEAGARGQYERLVESIANPTFPPFLAEVIKHSGE